MRNDDNLMNGEGPLSNPKDTGGDHEENDGPTKPPPDEPDTTG